MSEAVARALAARRVSLWRIDERTRDLICLEAYDQETKGHAAGALLHRAECPELIEALVDGEEIAVDDAAQDARTAKLAEIYLQPLGCRSLVSAPIAIEDRVIGCLWVEDPGGLGQEGVDARAFVHTVARLLAAQIERTSPAAVGAPAAVVAAGGMTATMPADPSSRAPLAVPAPTLRNASLADARSAALLRQISGRGLGDERLLGTVHPDLSVLVLRFFDDLAMAARAGPEDQIGVVGQIVAAFQEIAANRQVRYAKIMTNEIVAAAGFDSDPGTAAARLAEVALALQERCARSFGEVGRRLDFALGLDIGTAIGCAVGAEPAAYNLWGDAVRVASSLATTAQRGTIQVSEAAHERLCERVRVPPPRRLLSRAGRGDDHVRPAGADVSEVPAPATAAAPASVPAPAPAGRAGTAAGAILAAAALARDRGRHGRRVVRHGLRPSAWRRPARAEFLRFMDSRACRTCRRRSSPGILIGFSLVAQGMYWLAQFGEQELGVHRDRGDPDPRDRAAAGRPARARARRPPDPRRAERAAPRRPVPVLDRQGIDPFLALVMPRVPGAGGEPSLPDHDPARRRRSCPATWSGQPARGGAAAAARVRGRRRSPPSASPATRSCRSRSLGHRLRDRHRLLPDRAGAAGRRPAPSAP